MRRTNPYLNERRASRVPSWSSRALAAMTMTLVAGVGSVAGMPSASASDGFSGEAVAASGADQAAEVAKARAEATLMEEQRVDELMGLGMSRPEASAQVLKEQKAAAKRIRLRMIELAMQGMTPQEIADAIPGLVLAPMAVDGPAPLSSNGDLTLYKGTRTFARQCNCDTLSAEWKQDTDLENGQDVAGIRVTESVQNLGGSIVHCDIGPSPDQCWVDASVDYEDPQGVAHDFMSEEGERGTIYFSARQYSADGPGPCQMFSHYEHAWESVEIESVGISTDTISVSYTSVGHKWRVQRAGPGVAC